MEPLAWQQQIVQSLIECRGFPHPAPAVDRIETHISTVLLAGEHAYKIKKPLNLGFLDFSTLEARNRFCHAELEINRVLAPGIYLGVAEIRGTADEPHIGGDGPLLEYAVHMRRFDRARQLDRMLDAGHLPVETMDALARLIAGFHETAERAASDSPHGNPEQVLAPMLANFEALAPTAASDAEAGNRLARLERWTREAGARLQPLLLERRTQGFIRACHGDMHLGNMVFVDDPSGHQQIAVFDGIEFSAPLRWIDVFSEIAFLTMDLHARGAHEHAHRVLEGYLAQRDDFGGLALLPFYQVYRALVRAKVHAIHAAEPGLAAAERTPFDTEVRRYLALAETLAKPGQPGLILMHGVSGSGKTHVSTEILQRLGAIRLRTDVERKRAIGIAPETRPDSRQTSALYSPDAVADVYARLLARSESLLRLGQLVIVDATFLTRERREPFLALAGRLAVPCIVVACNADRDTLRGRILAREQGGHDPSDAGIAVMERQLEQAEPPGAGENPITLQPGMPPPWSEIGRLLRRGDIPNG